VVNFIMAGYKDNLLGEANSFLEVLEQVSRLAPLNKPVLIIGERGTVRSLSPTACIIYPGAGMALYFP
jgi:psp operon transcriptional activator